MFNFWKKTEPEKRNVPAFLQNCLLDSLPTLSGVQVTESTAIGLSALSCGLKVISEAVGTLPIKLYQEGEDRSEVTQHDVLTLLEKPNPEWSAPVVFGTAQYHALLYGTGYLEIVRDGAGRPKELWNIHPRLITPFRDDNGVLAYTVNNQRIDASDIIAIPGLMAATNNAGHSLLQIARETISFGLATTAYGSAFYGNGSRPSGVLEVAGSLSDQARTNLKNSWSALYSGPTNAGKVAILEEGLKFSPMTMTMEQNQYIQVLNYFNVVVSQMLNLSPVFLQDLQRATWSNLGDLNTMFARFTLNPWLVKWEAELGRKLLNDDSLYLEFDLSGLLRADQKTRFENYATAIASGFMTINEARRLENMPPLEGNTNA